jgi:hypothetical protein
LARRAADLERHVEPRGPVQCVLFERFELAGAPQPTQV